MEHIESKNEIMIEPETVPAPETANENEESSSVIADEMEEASSPKNKRTAPEQWEDESTRSNNHEDTEPLLQMTAGDEEKGGMVARELSSSDKQDEQKQFTTSNDKLSVDTLPPPRVVPQRPVKKARTAYFIFAEEKRPELQKQVCACMRLCATDWLP